MSVTEKNISCVKWNEHTSKLNDGHFPLDVSITAAQNYCRQPTGNLGSKPWCYTKTTAPNTYWGYCSIDRCGENEKYILLLK